MHLALCVLVLAGCTSGGPQGAGDTAGRQAPTPVAGDVTATTVLSIADGVYASGDVSSAISFYRRAIAIDPTLAKAYIGLGEALLAAGYPNEANEAFTEAQSRAAHEPASPERTSHQAEAMRGLGVTLLTLNQPVGAIELLTKANAIAPAANIYSALGIAEDLLGDQAAADKAYKQGLALAPNDLDLQNNYGLSQALHGDFDGAVATLRHVASDPKATARHRLNLALALGLAGRTDDAAQVARIDLDERSVRSNLAYYAELRGLPAKARAAAILRPGKPLDADAVRDGCDAQSCPKPALPAEKLSAIPTTPVAANPLPAPASAKTAKVPMTELLPVAETAAAVRTVPSQRDAVPSSGSTYDNTAPIEQAEVAKDGDPVTEQIVVMPAQKVAISAPPAAHIVKTVAKLPSADDKRAWLQIIGFRSEQNARSAWKKMATGNGDQLRHASFSVQRVNLGSNRGVDYVLRVGPFADRQGVLDLCPALKNDTITCLVAN